MGWSKIRQAFWFLVLPIGARWLYFSVLTASTSADSARYLSLATAIQGGKGFHSLAELLIIPPPGYPLFLATLLSLFPSLTFVRAVQCLLSIASGYLIFAAIAPRNKRLAWLGLYLMALSPWTAQFMVNVLSETLGIFLGSAAIYFLSLIEQKKHETHALFILGALLVALLLTSPAMLPIAFGLLAYLTYCYRRRTAMLLPLWGGWLLAFFPWYAFCYVHSGRVPLAGYYTVSQKWTESAYPNWLRSWSTDSRSLHYLWYPADLARAPEEAFKSPEEKARIVSALSRYQRGEISSAQWDEVFQELVAEQKKTDPVGYYVLKPAARAFFLWLDMGVLGRLGTSRIKGLWSEEPTVVGWSVVQETKAQRIAYAGLSLLVFAAFLSQLVFLLWLWVRAAVEAKTGYAILIAAAILGYTFMSANSALGEARRNYPFLPFLLFLGFYASQVFRDTTVGEA